MWQIYPHAIEWQFHRYWFLFWQLIFGRPGVADLPHVEQQFHRFWFLFWQLIFGRSGVADLLPPHSMAISQILIPIQTAHIWQTRGGRSTPTPVNSNFTGFDSYSDSSYLADQVWQIYPHPIELQFHRFWFLFWQLIYGRPGVADLPPPYRMAISQILIPILTAHIWQTMCGRSNPTPLNSNFTDVDSYSDSSYLADQVWQIYPHPIEWQFHRFWFLFWQLIFCRSGVADLPPPYRMAISQILIPILTAHIWQTRCGRSTPTQ